MSLAINLKGKLLNYRVSIVEYVSLYCFDNFSTVSIIRLVNIHKLPIYISFWKILLVLTW